MKLSLQINSKIWLLFVCRIVMDFLDISNLQNVMSSILMGPKFWSLWNYTETKPADTALRKISLEISGGVLGFKTNPLPLTTSWTLESLILEIRRLRVLRCCFAPFSVNIRKVCFFIPFFRGGDLAGSEVPLRVNLDDFFIIPRGKVFRVLPFFDWWTSGFSDPNFWMMIFLSIPLLKTNREWFTWNYS